MTHNRHPLDDYDDYDALYNPLRNDRQQRRARKAKAGRHTPKKSEAQIRAELAPIGGTEGSFQTTYRPSRYEEGWLLDSLRDFYRQEYITDVLALVRGGKEASVYRCAARPGLGIDLLAAKVYRPRQFRHLRNDKLYREGRGILTLDGQDLNQSLHNDRVMRAIGKKTDYGRQVMHTSWLMHEFTTLQTLYSIGAAVPRPVAASPNAILMSYIGGPAQAAPALNDVELDRDEAQALFDETLRNIELMLAHGMIHGDLSAYNILYWEGRITLIDFPQVTSSQGNSQAQMILQRDIERVCDYFAAQGVARDPAPILRRLWKQHVERRAQDVAADLSRLNAEPE